MIIYLYTSKSDQEDNEVASGYVIVYDASGDIFMEYEGEYILDADVTIYVYVKESEKNSIIHATLMHYQDVSDHISVEYVDPNTDPVFYQTYTDSTVSSNSLFIVSDQRSKVVDADDIIEYTYDYSTYYSTGWKMEVNVRSWFL